ncbi:uroporphyrinogen decarboxylase [bacterium]|nr:MAG: uroporphyrinogen decarboxylase [bacterium]
MNDTFLRACRGEEVPYTPVWIMRQAGRYLNQYQKIRKKVDFLTLCKTPELAAEVTIQPIDALGVDAAILFSDILIPVEAMGIKLEFFEKRGPVLSPPVRSKADLDRLSVPNPEERMSFVLETIKILRRELANKVPLIGFSGAPLTTATYIIEGGTSKNFLHTKQMAFQTPDVFGSLMDTITQTVTDYLRAQIMAGAQAVQLFDTWAGIFSPGDYRSHVLPYVKKIIQDLREWQRKEKREAVPIIYFVGECAGLLEEIKSSGADVYGIDWRIGINDAVKRLGDGVVVQGNLDPCSLFLPQDKIQERVSEILTGAAAAQGHIFNLGHGVLPTTPVENVVTLVDTVHSLSRK